MSDNDAAFAADLVDRLLDARLDSTDVPPGLRDATVALVARAMHSGEVEKLFRDQLRQLRHPSSTAIPDAYLADDAATENGLQLAAAGLRLAMAQNGLIVDPRSFEDNLASDLSDDPALAVRAELARTARPTTRPRPLRWSIPPAPWDDQARDDTAWPSPEVRATSALRSLEGGSSALARADDAGPRGGWVQIGLIERQRTPARSYPEQPQRTVIVGVGSELLDRPPKNRTLPFTSAPWQLWIVPSWHIDPAMDAAAAATILAIHEQPIVALPELGRRTSGLGEPPLLLTPTLPLIVALELEPTPGVCGLNLSDAHGQALVGRLWRGHPVHDGTYEPVFPAVEGADLLLRPDLFEQLLRAVDDTRFHTGVSITHDPREENAENTDPTPRDKPRG